MSYTGQKGKSVAKVLIIEDDAEIRMVYSFALNHAGFQVLEAPDATSGLTLLQQGYPDVVVLDMLMPGMSGLDFLRQNNIHERYPGIKIIAFSNIENERVMNEAKDLGVVRYLVKASVTPHQLADIIKEITA